MHSLTKTPTRQNPLDTNPGNNQSSIGNRFEGLEVHDYDEDSSTEASQATKPAVTVTVLEDEDRAINDKIESIMRILMLLRALQVSWF